MSKQGNGVTESVEEVFIRCEVRQGMFSSEYGVRFRLFPEGSTTAFVSRRDVRLANGEPKSEKAVEGELRVNYAGKQYGFARIVLPQPSIDGQTRVMVPADILVEA